MNTPLYIARRLKGDHSPHGKISRLGTRIATISVAISILVMIVALAIVRGFRTEIEAKAMGFTGQILMEAPGAGFVTESLPMSTQLSYLPALAQLPGVDHIQPFAISNGLVKTEQGIEGIQLKGVDASYRWDFFEQALVDGRLPELSDSLPSQEVLISRRMSDRLGLNTGDQMLVYFISQTVRMRRFTISGLYNAQLGDIDNHLIIGDIRITQPLNGWTSSQVSGLEIFLPARQSIETQQDLMESFIMEHSAEQDDGVVLQNVRRKFAHLYDWLNLLDMNVIILLGLMVLVAGFNMISGLLIMLFEKTSMIGLLKGMGMRDGQIRQCFLLRSASITAKGMAWGTVLAVAFCIVQSKTHLIKLDATSYFVDSVPIQLHVTDVLIADLGGMLVLMLLLLLPLQGIVKMSPSQAIKSK